MYKSTIMTPIAIIVIVLLVSPKAEAFIGFDCSTVPRKVMTISLVDTIKCNTPATAISTKKTHIQLLQLSNYDQTSIKTCKVEISRTIHSCGLEMSIIPNAKKEYLFEVSREQCINMHKYGILYLNYVLPITNIKNNDITTRHITLGGNIGINGKCLGTSYSDPYGTWNKVTVEATVKITLNSSVAQVDPMSGRIFLQSGVTCEVKRGGCIGREEGYTYWDPIPPSTCDLNQFDILYEGMANKIQDARDSKNPVVYTLDKKKVTFGVIKTRELTGCKDILIGTIHPRIFIREIHYDKTPAARENISIDNLDIYHYMDSKFVYMEENYNLKRHSISLYNDIMMKHCKLMTEDLNLALLLAYTISPDIFAYILMKGHGYMAHIAGEVAYIVACIPVELVIRRTNKCYHELPVTKNNETLFMKPISGIISLQGREIKCDEFLSPQYHIADKWIKLSPHPSIVPPP